MSSVIKADNVSIRYITGDFKDIGLKEYFVKRLKGEYTVTEFWADRNVSFELERGDMLGIIGTNGAGKSTILKAISGIMVPTEGNITVKGSIAALLELASGFDGELTVRENTYLRGAMLGYTREFMEQMYDQIIEFAELVDFQERPFKQLSSGMKSRLAFSIACLVNPDVIILDEVLSVGDGAFKKKSGDKMREILDGGVTGILVSHSISQVREMCNKILWLDHGKQIAFTDDTELYLDAYEEFLVTKQLPQSIEDVARLAKGFHERTERERQQAERTEAQKLQAILEAGESEAATLAALNIIKKNKPELLKGYDARKVAEEDGPNLLKCLTRVSGGNKLQGSIAVAEKIREELAWDKLQKIVLCNEKNQLACLLSSNLANFVEAPLLMYNELNYKDAVAYVNNNISENSTIYTIGDSETVLTDIKNCSVVNFVSDNLIKLNLEILKYNKNAVTDLLICTGKNIIDNISAVATGKPFLLIDELLTDEQIDFIKSIENPSFYVIGGNAAVSKFIENQLKEFGKVIRLYGKTRYETSTMFASYFYKEPYCAALISGTDYTDGFYAGILAAIKRIPLVLADRAGRTVIKEYLSTAHVSQAIVLCNDFYLNNTIVNDFFDKLSN